MAASFLLSFREGLEAALIIGIIIGALYKTGRQELRPAVWRGSVLALILSIMAGVML